MAYAGESEGVTGASQMQQPPRLLAGVRRRLRLKHYSLRTEQAYVAWIQRLRGRRQLSGFQREPHTSV